jgi:hypothetical protein
MGRLLVHAARTASVAIAATRRHRRGGERIADGLVAGGSLM